MIDLLKVICDRIDQYGPITLADYMDLALMHPSFGYYRHGDPLGAEGDFVTAPEISQMFGEMVGLWLVNCWQELGRPAACTLLECGPGRGTLMADALRATAKVPNFHGAIDLVLLECNETLREKQRTALSSHPPRYVSTLSQLPQQPLLVVANEFFDALPVRQFEKTFQGWCERLVTHQHQELMFTLLPLDDQMLALIPSALKNATPGAVYEISLFSAAMMRDCAKHVAAHEGAALIIDYGYGEPSGQATLQAVLHHNYVPFLEQPGEADLTAHVDFSMLAGVARAQGVSVFGPLGQGEFLTNLGINVRAAQLQYKADHHQAEAIRSALRRLTDPNSMGSLFKVMALTTPRLKSVLGFL